MPSLKGKTWSCVQAFGYCSWCRLTALMGMSASGQPAGGDFLIRDLPASRLTLHPPPAISDDTMWFLLLIMGAGARRGGALLWRARFQCAAGADCDGGEWRDFSAASNETRD